MEAILIIHEFQWDSFKCGAAEIWFESPWKRFLVPRHHYECIKQYNYLPDLIFLLNYKVSNNAMKQQHSRNKIFIAFPENDQKYIQFIGINHQGTDLRQPEWMVWSEWL